MFSLVSFIPSRKFKLSSTVLKLKKEKSKKKNCEDESFADNPRNVDC